MAKGKAKVKATGQAKGKAKGQGQGEAKGEAKARPWQGRSAGGCEFTLSRTRTFLLPTYAPGAMPANFCGFSLGSAAQIPRILLAAPPPLPHAPHGD